MSYGVHEDVLLSRPKAGIPIRLRDKAQLVTGTFDKVVKRVSRVSTAQALRKQIQGVVDGVGQSSQPTGGNRYKNYLCHFCEKWGFLPCDRVEEKGGNCQEWSTSGSCRRLRGMASALDTEQERISECQVFLTDCKDVVAVDKVVGCERY